MIRCKICLTPFTPKSQNEMGTECDCGLKVDERKWGKLSWQEIRDLTTWWRELEEKLEEDAEF